MQFEFTPTIHFDYLDQFAKKFKVQIVNGGIQIPREMGTGSIRRVELWPDYQLLIHKYQFRKDFIIQCHPASQEDQLINIIFYSNEAPWEMESNGGAIALSKNSEYSILITSSNLESVMSFPAEREICHTVIGITSAHLMQLLQLPSENALIADITQPNASFLLYESMTADILKSLKQITEYKAESALQNFFYRNKVQELIFLVFEKLQQREHVKQRDVSPKDIQKLMELKDSILSQLNEPPSIKALAQKTAMSETKLKYLFKQVFGNSIYNFYQNARMEEAANLLKQGDDSVSEIGYGLGFTNLSHFSRLFEKHFGTTPKKYATYS